MGKDGRIFCQRLTCFLLGLSSICRGNMKCIHALISSCLMRGHLRSCCRRPRCRRRWVLLAGLLLSALTLIMLQYSILPAAIGAYNEECLNPEERQERMRFVLRHVVQFLNEENASYWLDYGTLLGAVRDGDIIAYDGDMDVSRLTEDLDLDRKMMHRFRDKMKILGIEGNAMIARYEDVQVDMFRWQSYNTSSGKMYLRKYYPFVPELFIAESISEFMFPTYTDPLLLFPLRQLSVVGVQAKIPNKILDFLKARYPLTWTYRIPYKWKCWVGAKGKG